MLEAIQNKPKDPQPVVPAGNDLTGRDRLVSNVLFSWGGQLVYIVAGFVMPRMIDHRLGQATLGIWDFSWSLVSYFRIVQLGVTSSVNRYVGKYRANGDMDGVNRIFNSVTCVLAIAGLLVLLFTVILVALLPTWLGYRLKEYVSVAQGSVFFLGAALSLQTAFGGFNGVLTGCHRWELQSTRQTGWYFATVVAMLIALLKGGGLVMLAGITFAGEAFSQLTMVTLAYRVCEGLRLDRSFVNWGTIKEQYIFGVKTLIPSISAMLLNQTTSLLIVAYLGPAALALFTRPRALTIQMDTILRKMAMILIPMTSSLEAGEDLKEVKKLLAKSVRYSLYLSLPMILGLVIFGGPIMQLWMGERYANGWIPAIIAIGFIASCIQTPILSMLCGLNAHGRAGVAQLLASLCSVGLTVLMLRYFGAGLVGTAVAVTLPLMVANLAYLPRLICRRLGLDLGSFVRQSATGPVLHVLPFATALVLARVLYQRQPVVALGVFLTGSVTLVISYWRCVLPDSMKAWVRLHLEKAARSVGVLASKSATL